MLADRRVWEEGRSYCIKNLTAPNSHRESEEKSVSRNTEVNIAMKSLALANTVLSLLNAHAQTNPNLQSMVDAERAFIAMAKDQNRRDAFLFFLSENAITQGPNGPVKGKERIKNQPVKNDWLSWEIAYSDIAASGDFGFNTGPWEYRSNKIDVEPVAYGEFNSIWKKQPDGLWKNILDIGISHSAPTKQIIWATSRRPLRISKKNKSVAGGNKELLSVEYEFLKLNTLDRKAAYKKYLSDEARINYSGNLPFTTREDKQKYVDDFPSPANPQLIHGECAASYDLGYVYGNADVTVMKDSKSENKKACYVRVWKKENGGWRIVLDILSF